MRRRHYEHKRLDTYDYAPIILVILLYLPWVMRQEMLKRLLMVKGSLTRRKPWNNK
jgi:hypothetical protein